MNLPIARPRSTFLRRSAAAGLLFLGALLAYAATQTDIAGPAGSGQFGNEVVVLSNGNFVVADPGYDITSPSTILNVGAVHLYDGATRARISTLTGSTANDQVGINNGPVLGVTALPNGNFTVMSFNWDNNGVVNAGALTFCSGTTGCNGTISAANSLVGTQTNDLVSGAGVRVLKNGNYLVISLNWDNGTAIQAGALTWCSGTSGCSGPVSPANSLVGSTANDRVSSIEPALLSDGDYVVLSPGWDGAAADTGAATWCSGATGCTGVVSSANSLVGTQATDVIGGRGITELTSGDYVVQSPGWDNGTTTAAGAVTWCSGGGGCVGAVSAANSVVGSTPSETVGEIVVALSNGNYVVASPNWDTIQSNVGAVRLCNGGGGCTGPFTTSNSLTGSESSDAVGTVVALTNGNYVVLTPSYNSTTQSDVGAATFCDGTIGCTGGINANNSLVSTFGNSRLGSNGAAALSNGNYVVLSPGWGGSLGAATWCSGTSGCTGAVNSSNSLVGSASGDEVGGYTTLTLPNGNYVVVTPRWNNAAIVDAGAATYCNGATGCSGTISSANSLVGTKADDIVGGNNTGTVFVLANGNYIIPSPFWDNGATVNAGAVTWCNGSTGCTGPVSSANSVIGSTANETLQNAKGLLDGDYVISSPGWDNTGSADAGAVRWCDGSVGCTGVLTAANSLVGSTTGDAVGNGFITALANGDYIVPSQSWDNGAIVNAGAVTYAKGDGSTVGPITSDNSVRGMVANRGFVLTSRKAFDPVNQQLVVGRSDENLVTLLKLSGSVPLSSVASIKAHGGAGAFSVPLPLAGNPGIESRNGGASGNHTVVFTFATNLTSVGSATVSNGTGTVATSAIGADPHEYIVELTGVSNAQVLTITLANVSDSSGNNSATVAVSMGLLVGDSNADRNVNSGDLTQTRNRSGEPTGAANFRSDYNLDGTINSGDATVVRSRSGQFIP